MNGSVLKMICGGVVLAGIPLVIMSTAVAAPDVGPVIAGDGEAQHTAEPSAVESIEDDAGDSEETEVQQTPEPSARESTETAIEDASAPERDWSAVDGSASSDEAGELDTDPLQNAVFDRPFVISGQRASVGGYAEAQYRMTQEDGVRESGFEMQRFNLFFFAPIGSRIRFLAELEFEEGAEVIKLETAQLDIVALPELVFRAGIILSPIGGFNQRHDGPLWNFVDRPMVSTTLIPSTFSEVGAGVHGVFEAREVAFDYQLYVTQGLANGVLDNDLGRVSIPAGRSSELFGRDTNSRPAVSGRLAARVGDKTEFGLSGWHGAYNTWILAGEEVDERRTLSLAALDFAWTPPWLELRGEFAAAWIDVPDNLRSSYGWRQWGGFMDVVVPVLRTEVLRLPSTVALGLRFEYVDYHAGKLANGDNAGEDTARVTLAAAFRPGNQTVFRMNYGLQWTRDLPGNAPVRAAHLQLGFATYF